MPGSSFQDVPGGCAINFSLNRRDGFQTEATKRSVAIFVYHSCTCIELKTCSIFELIVSSFTIGWFTIQWLRVNHCLSFFVMQVCLPSQLL